MNPQLRDRLLKASAGGALAIAAVLAANFEGTVYRPYRDPVGIWTVCEGITGPDVVQGKTYTAAECSALKQKHLKVAETAAKKVLLHWGEYDIWTQAALVDFTYNTGANNLAASTLAKLFNAGDHDGGCMQLRLWVKGRVRGQLVTLNGLVERRGVEQEICLGALQ